MRSPSGGPGVVFKGKSLHWLPLKLMVRQHRFQNGSFASTVAKLRCYNRVTGQRVAYQEAVKQDADMTVALDDSAFTMLNLIEYGKQWKAYSANRSKLAPTPYWKPHQNKDYFDAVVKVRTGILNHPQMKKVLQDWWNVMPLSYKVWTVSGGIDYKVYLQLSININHVLRPNLTQASLTTMAEKEWKQVNDQCPQLSEAMFEDLLFQLADAWCTDASGRGYASFLRELLLRCTREGPKKQRFLSVRAETTSRRMQHVTRVKTAFETCSGWNRLRREWQLAMRKFKQKQDQWPAQKKVKRELQRTGVLQRTSTFFDDEDFTTLPGYRGVATENAKVTGAPPPRPASPAPLPALRPATPPSTEPPSTSLAATSTSTPPNLDNRETQLPARKIGSGRSRQAGIGQQSMQGGVKGGRRAEWSGAFLPPIHTDDGPDRAASTLSGPRTPSILQRITNSPHHPAARPQSVQGAAAPPMYEEQEAERKCETAIPQQRGLSSRRRSLQSAAQLQTAWSDEEVAIINNSGVLASHTTVGAHLPPLHLKPISQIGHHKRRCHSV